VSLAGSPPLALPHSPSSPPYNQRASTAGARARCEGLSLASPVVGAGGVGSRRGAPAQRMLCAACHAAACCAALASEPLTSSLQLAARRPCTHGCSHSRAHPCPPLNPIQCFLGPRQGSRQGERGQNQGAKGKWMHGGAAEGLRQVERLRMSVCLAPCHIPFPFRPQGKDRRHGKDGKARGAPQQRERGAERRRARPKGQGWPCRAARSPAGTLRVGEARATSRRQQTACFNKQAPTATYRHFLTPPLASNPPIAAERGRQGRMGVACLPLPCFQWRLPHVQCACLLLASSPAPLI
jgi:hypothetical protein